MPERIYLKEHWDLFELARGKGHTPWEEEFMASMERRHEEHGDETFITERQVEILQKIAGE